VSEKGPKSFGFGLGRKQQIFFLVFLETKFDWFFTLVSWKNGMGWCSGGQAGAASAAFFVLSSQLLLIDPSVLTTYHRKRATSYLCGPDAAD